MVRVAGCILTFWQLITLLSSNFVFSKDHLKFLPAPIAGAGVQSFVHGIDRFSPAGEVQTYCRALLGTEPELKIDIVQIDPATATVCHTTIFFFQKHLFAEYLPLATS